ncbi:hypothetical protein ABPG74_015281 [Tetrahymena malaccensis]
MEEKLSEVYQKQMKKINSHPNNQLKSIEDDGIMQGLGQRNNQMNSGSSNAQLSKEDNLRDTLRRPPPRIIAGKMPEAFFTKKKNQLSSLNGKVQQLGIFDAQKNIDNLIEQQQYNQAQNLLQPINVNEERMSPQPNDQANQQELIQKKQIMKPSQNLKNPIGSYRTYMQNMQLITEAIKEPMEWNKEKLQQFLDAGKNNNNKISSSSIKLEEMITLGVIKCQRDSGVVKKIFHAPTLRLYSVKEVPLSSKQARQNLRDWVIFWQNKLHNTGKHVKLYGHFWNVPEGCVSILTEFLSGGSLQDLLESFGTLPESIIKQIAIQTISALDVIHNISNSYYGGLTPSQILFKQDGNVKLSLGISYRSQQQQQNFFNSVNMSKQNERMSLFDPSGVNTPNLFKVPPLDNNNNNNNNNNHQNQKAQIQKQDDVFRLGMLVLSCAIGSFDIIENVSLLYECIHKLLDDQNKPDPQYRVCCILHAEDILQQMMDEKLKINSKKQRINLSINNLLTTNRFTKEFLDFLCQTLRFNYQSRSTLANLKQHPFLSKEVIPKGVNINITDLLKHSQGWSRNQSLPADFQGASEQVLERLCEGMLLVLPMCEKWFVASNYQEYTRHIKSLKPESSAIQILSQDLGLDAKLVYSKLIQVFDSFPFINTKRNAQGAKVIDGVFPPFFQDNNNQQAQQQQQQYQS